MLMSVSITKEEIDEMIKQISPHITDVKPRQLLLYYGEEEIKEAKETFSLLDKIFVKRLEKLSSIVSRKTKTYYPGYNSENLSINERLSILKTYLTNQGFTSSQLYNAVPHTMEEIDVLSEAMKLGFDVEETWDISTLINDATKYILESKSNSLDENHIKR